MRFNIMLLVLLVCFSNKAYSGYKGSNSSRLNINSPKAFWHSSTINRIQLGWDKRIYVFLNKPIKCDSDHIFYHPDITIGREMMLMALLKYEEQKRVISFRIDECRVTGGGVNYGVFDKIEARPLKRNWLGNYLFNNKE